jgi:hypothetical protein
MTDFLTRLAEQTLGMAPIAQPSIASMFAPGPTLGGNTVTTYGEDDVPAGESEREQAVPVRDSLERALQREPDFQPPVPRSSVQSRVLARNEVLLARGRHEANPFVSPTTVSIAEEQAGTHRMHLLPSRASVLPATEEALAGKDQAGSLPDSASRLNPSETGNISHVIQMVQPVPSSTSRNVPAASLEVPRISAPTIRVTIGRIEVRAVMPSDTRILPTPQRPKPRLSLDDYLKQRHGGRR